MEDLLLDEPLRFLPPDGVEWPEVTAWGHREWTHWLLEHNKYPFLKAWTPPQIDQYLQVDRYNHGLGFRRSEKEPYTWFYLPTPVAVPYHACKAPNILFGGAAGGSKSHSLRYDAYEHCFAIPNFRAILMRRTFEELERNHLDHVRSEEVRFNEYFGKQIVTYTGGRHEVSFACHGAGRDSKIIFGHCQNVGDEEKYLGPAYDGFYPDEMATFDRKQIIGIAGRLRTDKRGVVARMAGGSNPGGANTLWLKDWFIDKKESQIRDQFPRYRADRYAFIPAMLYDNPYYMDPDGTYTNYEDRLFAYDAERRKQLLLGDWSALAGQFFPEFKPWDSVKGGHLLQLDTIPPGCKIERWIDWGYDPHYGICLWAAVFPNGRIYVFYEYKFNGENSKQKLVASEVAKRIKKYTLDDVLPMARSTRITKSIADPSMWSGDGHTGEDYAETFRKNGVHLTAGDHDRVMGWGRLRHWFRDAPDGSPWLLVHPRCETLIRTLPGLIKDKSDPEDCDTHGEDHPADALRYGVMSRPTPTRFKTSLPGILPFSVAEILQQMNAQQERQAGMVS
jgi:hypothetical protein